MRPPLHAHRHDRIPDGAAQSEMSASTIHSVASKLSPGAPFSCLIYRDSEDSWQIVIGERRWASTVDCTKVGNANRLY
jgi:hypothetical protein